MRSNSAGRARRARADGNAVTASTTTITPATATTGAHAGSRTDDDDPDRRREVAPDDASDEDPGGQADDEPGDRGREALPADRGRRLPRREPENPGDRELAPPSATGHQRRVHQSARPEDGEHPGQVPRHRADLTEAVDDGRGRDRHHVDVGEPIGERVAVGTRCRTRDDRPHLGVDAGAPRRRRPVPHGTASRSIPSSVSVEALVDDVGAVGDGETDDDVVDGAARRPSSR